MFFGVVWLAATAAGAATNYVSQTSTNPVSPYNSWATAATSIQAAIDVAANNNVVLVSNGVYNTGGKVMKAR